jgi:hypothetical protein
LWRLARRAYGLAIHNRDRCHDLLKRTGIARRGVARDDREHVEKGFVIEERREDLGLLWRAGRFRHCREYRVQARSIAHRDIVVDQRLVGAQKSRFDDEDAHEPHDA